MTCLHRNLQLPYKRQQTVKCDRFYQRSDGTVSSHHNVPGVAPRLDPGSDPEPPATPEDDEPAGESVSAAAPPERNLAEGDAPREALSV